LSGCFAGALRHDILLVGNEWIENSGNASAIVKK